MMQAQWSGSNYKLPVLSPDKLVMTMAAREAMTWNRQLKADSILTPPNFSFREGKHDLLWVLVHLDLESTLAERDACSKIVAGMPQLQVAVGEVLPTLMIIAQTLDRQFLELLQESEFLYDDADEEFSCLHGLVEGFVECGGNPYSNAFCSNSIKRSQANDLFYTSVRKSNMSEQLSHPKNCGWRVYFQIYVRRREKIQSMEVTRIHESTPPLIVRVIEA